MNFVIEMPIREDLGARTSEPNVKENVQNKGIRYICCVVVNDTTNVARQGGICYKKRGTTFSVYGFA